VDGIYYDIHGNDATVTYKSGPEFVGCFSDYTGDVNIPNTVTYDGVNYTVTAIDNYAFVNCNDLTSVTIPNTITIIGNYSFYDCTSLTIVTIPNSVTTIGTGAFYNCTNLSTINIPNSVTYINNDAFRGTLWFKNQPDGLIYVGNIAYKYKGTMLPGSSIIIKEGTISITGGAFYDCNGLTNISIPNSVVAIGSSAFDGTTWYDNQPDGVVYAGSVAYKYKGNMPVGTSISLNDGTQGITASAFFACNNLSNITIPNTVTNIGDYAFTNCGGLTSISIPSSVTYIGEMAFSCCNSLRSIKVDSQNTFYDSRNNCNAIIKTSNNELILGCENTVIPQSVLSIGFYAFYDCHGLTNIVFPDSLTSICRNAFQDCSELTYVTLGNSLKAIGELAFRDCTNLTNVTIPDSVINIGIEAFSGCRGLTNIIIPNSVKSIGFIAFANCSSLSSIIIGSSLTTIGGDAFSGCDNLTEISVVEGNPKYDSRDSCNAIIETASNSLIAGCKNTSIPSSVTSIGNYAFSGYSSLTNIDIPYPINNIGMYSFSYCTGLTSVSIPSSVNTIDYGAFYGCENLNSIFCFASEPPKIDRWSFTDHSAILYVPDFSVELYKSANYWNNFSNIVGIPITFELDGIHYRAKDTSSVSVIANPNEGIYYTDTVVIPESATYEEWTFVVTSIENNAFDDCAELTSVTIGDSVHRIGEQAFQGCTNLIEVTIGSGVTEIGEKAFNYCNALQTVTCRSTAPPVMASANSFSNTTYNRATLLVPRNFIDRYQTTNYWYKFSSIVGFGSAGPGDADCDGEISINDVTVLIDILLGNEVESFDNISADLNDNGHIDIGDVSTLIDYLLTATN
jgi:hypothetical protein